jgi:poly(A) polymerase
MRVFALPPSRLIGELRRALETAVEAGEIPGGQSAEAYIEFVRADPARFGIPVASSQ